MNVLREVELSKLPVRAVNRSEWRQAALTAGWKLKVVNLFLAPGTAICRKPLKVGEEALTLQE